MPMKKKVVFLTGAGMSVESGFKTFRGNDGLWENYPVEQVASHQGWEADPTLVTHFYNMLRRKLWDAEPNQGHRLIAALEADYDVAVLTQNVDGGLVGRARQPRVDVGDRPMIERRGEQEAGQEVLAGGVEVGIGLGSGIT